MINFSEYVSLGHPDKVADYISQYLLDRYIERDPHTRYAVEVQIKDHIVTLGGEVSSTVSFSKAEISAFVRAAVNEIGYTSDYQSFWGAENTICGDSLIIFSNIGQQSPDIAQGLNGWGDHGIFFGMCTPDRRTYGMPYDHSLAKELCRELFNSKMGGLDIKTQVVTEDGQPVKIIVAIPLDPERGTATPEDVEAFIRIRVDSKRKYEVIINGTGRYVQHGSIADCGTTGRKLAVDFYGGNCYIGGGSPWTKDGSKADLALNLVARRLAKNYTEETGVTTYTRLACCIGKQEVDFSVTDAAGNIIAEGVSIFDPVLAEVLCKWFTPAKGDSIFDCFAGDTNKGLVFGMCGYQFTGVELRQEQVDINNEVLSGRDLPVRYICDDGRNVANHFAPESQDLLFSCPPYFDLEVYSDLPNDASNQGSYEDFIGILRNAFSAALGCLKNDRFAVIVVGDVRNKKTGGYYDFCGDIKRIFRDNGAELYNEIILVETGASTALRAGQYMESRKVAKMHQNILVFYKGNTKNIKSNFPKIEYASEDLEQFRVDSGNEPDGDTQEV